MNISQLHKSFLTSQIVLTITFVFFILFHLLRIKDGNSTELWSSMLIQMGIAVFLLYLNQTFVIIRKRSFLPAFFFLLLTGTNSSLFFEPRGSILALSVVINLFFLFSTYQNPNSQKEALNISLIISGISLLWFPIIFLFPLFWYGMFRFNSLNWKTFFASITGIIIIYLFWFCWSLYQNDLSLFTNKILHFHTIWDIQLFKFNLKDFLILGLLFILFVLSGINIFMAGISEKVKTIFSLRYLYLFTLVVFILFITKAVGEKEWILIMYIPLSYLLGHYFTLITRKWNSFLFFFTILFFILIFLYPIIFN